MRDIQLGNTRSKIVQFHKGMNAIHDIDREKVNSIIPNLKPPGPVELRKQR